MMKPVFIVILSQMITWTKQSITGLTYMDDYDFEEKYRDINECDPSYWHPLHLPEECAKMFEKLIRNQIPGTYPYPVRILTSDPQPVYKQKSRKKHRKKKKLNSNFYDVMELGNGKMEIMSLDSLMNPVPSMYEGLLKQLTKEAANTPVAATFAVIPPLGPVALYRQPVSRRSEKLIKKWARKHTYIGDMNDNTRKLMYYQEIPKGDDNGNIDMIKKKMQSGDLFINKMDLT